MNGFELCGFSDEINLSVVLSALGNILTDSTGYLYVRGLMALSIVETGLSDIPNILPTYYLLI